MFIEHATLLKKHGAAVVVMAFDEEGKESEGEEKDVGEQICSILRGKGFNLHQQGQRTGNHMKLPNITKFHLDKESEYELKDISEDLR